MYNGTMYITEITFYNKGNNIPDKEILRDISEGYLAALLKNGQICGKYLLGWKSDRLTAYVYIPQADAFEISFHSEWGKSELEKLCQMTESEPEYVIFDNKPDCSVSWDTADSFVLFTHMTDCFPPVCRCDTGEPIPAYLLPLSDKDREHLYLWASEYRNHDSIWMASGDLEMAAYRQLAEPKSGLSRTGRTLCEKIEKVTGIPTYYYLHRHWGRKKGEADRICPECGGNWNVRGTSGDNSGFSDFFSQADPDSSDFWDFTFRCDHCRLVSHGS